MFEDALPLKVKDVLKKLGPLIYEENFYLAGGTGLALQIGHRLSEDLDFFRNSLFNEESLIIKLRNRANSFAGIIIEKFKEITATFKKITGPDTYPHRIYAYEALAQGELVILHAPTRSGKSVAVFVPFVELRGKSLSNRIIYSLPIRALVNSLHERLKGYGPKLEVKAHKVSMSLMRFIPSNHCLAFRVRLYWPKG